MTLALGLLLSIAAHAPLLPLETPSRWDVRDVEGEAAIPIDVLAPDPPPSSEPASEAPPEPPKSEEPSPLDPSLAKADAGRARDANALDADTIDARDGSDKDAQDAAADASADARSDGSSEAGSAERGLDADGGADRARDASADGAGPGVDASAKPEALAVPELVSPELVLVTLAINAEAIRRSAVGATISLLLQRMPQWVDFMSGTTIDPIKDVDWYMVSGPSLVNTGRDVVLVRYAAPDKVIDRAVAIVAHKSDHGGHVDAGVPNVSAVLAHADRADRLILRPQPHILAVVPPSDGVKIARQLAVARIKSPIMPGVAVTIRLLKPQRPFPELPETISELRVRVEPRPDEGADVFAEGDTPDAESAVRAAAGVTAFVRRHDDIITSLLTHGLLNHVVVRSEGSRVTARLSASRDQVETVIGLAASLLGVDLPAPGASAPSGGTLGAPPKLR